MTGLSGGKGSHEPTAANRLGYVVVEMKPGKLEPSSAETVFAWDGGDLHETPEDAESEAVSARETDRRFDYRVAVVTLVEVP